MSPNTKVAVTPSTSSDSLKESITSTCGNEELFVTEDGVSTVVVVKKEDDASGTIRIDYSSITEAAVTDVNEILEQKTPSTPSAVLASLPMKGFDTTDFVDIVDYILKITHWIWHEKKVDLCHDYYSKDCILHTMVGDIHGSQTVVDNTWATLKSFSDRTLDGENIVWSVDRLLKDNDNDNEDFAYYSSHLIMSRMTNDGIVPEWGQTNPTNIRVSKLKTIADCVCYKNKIIEEWLMRDNSYLAEQLGLDITEIAAKQAQNDIKDGKENIIEFLEKERNRVTTKNENKIFPPVELSSLPSLLSPTVGTRIFDDRGSNHSMITNSNNATESAIEYAETILEAIWMHDDESMSTALPILYNHCVSGHMPRGRELYGTLEMKEFFEMYREGLSDVRISVDHVACIPYMSKSPKSKSICDGSIDDELDCYDAIDMSIRWTLVGKHTGKSKVLGEPSDAPIYILAGTQWRIVRSNSNNHYRIREEWTVFDEIALLKQIETYRLMMK